MPSSVKFQLNLRAESFACNCCHLKAIKVHEIVIIAVELKKSLPLIAQERHRFDALIMTLREARL